MMSKQLILVIDSDPKNISILKDNLEAAGFQTITAADGFRAWQEIQNGTPQLILTEITIPELNGFQLLEKLQADPNYSHIPLVFLTNQRDVQQRVRAFQLGAKDYLIKPLHVKEVIAHIRMVLRRTQKRQIDNSRYFMKVSGQLSEMSVADLIEKFSVERKSGVLTLNNGNNKTGKIYLRDGMIINASVGDLRMESAVYQMLPWNQGIFNMVYRDVHDIPDEISISNFGLLIEGAKRIEQMQEYLGKFPSPETVFAVTQTFLNIIRKKKLADDVTEFISMIDGKRTIRQIIEDSHYEYIKTLERLHRLYQQGFIESAIETTTIEKAPVREESPPPVKLPIPKIIEKTEAPIEIPEKPVPVPLKSEEKKVEIKAPEAAELTKIRELEIVPSPEIAEESKKTPEIKAPVVREKFIAPIFNREEFIKKQEKIPTWDKPQSPLEVKEERRSVMRIESDEGKNHLLIIGFDEDILDEAMDLMTGNTFKTQKIEALENIPIHFGKIADKRYHSLNLFGLYPEKSFMKFIEAQRDKLLTNVFFIDCSSQDMCDYANYLMHTIWTNYQIPFVVGIANYANLKTSGFELVRHKLNLNPEIPIFIWDGDEGRASVNKLLSLIRLTEREDGERTEVLNELVSA